MLSASAVDNKIKILFVFPGGTKDRDQVFIKSFNQLHKTFPNLQDLKKVIGLVITQANDYFSGTDLLKQLDSDNMNTELKEFIHYFMTHEDQVFCFPEALPQNINQNYDFEDHDKLMYFILNNYKKNPDYRIAISKDAEREIDIEIFKHLESIKAITSKFSDMLSSQYNKENDSSSIKSWLEKMKNLANIEIKTPNGCKNAVQKNLADYEIYDDCIELLIENEAYGCFLDKIKHQNTISSFYTNNFKTLFNNSIKELEKNLLHAQNIENQQIENEKCLNKIKELETTIIANEEIQKEISNQFPIGTLFYSSRTEDKIEGSLKCNGQTVCISQYSYFVDNFLKTKKVKTIPISKWKKLKKNGDVGCFGYDGGDIFIVPLISSGTFLSNANVHQIDGESMKQGKFKNDQIMNISGSTSFTLLSLDDNNTIQSHGSLTNKCIGARNSTVKYCGKEDHWMKTQDISFDASKSVRTGDRVMPRTIFENLYVYIGS